MSRTPIDDLLDQARRSFRRLTPTQTLAAQAAGAVVVDTRDMRDRSIEGVIPDSVHLPLSVLPWRVDPDGANADPRVNDLQRHIVLVCNDGYSSSLAAARMVTMGFENVHDLVGGYRAWIREGLPTVEAPSVDARQETSANASFLACTCGRFEKLPGSPKQNWRVVPV